MRDGNERGMDIKSRARDEKRKRRMREQNDGDKRRGEWTRGNRNQKRG